MYVYLPSFFKIGDDGFRKGIVPNAKSDPNKLLLENIICSPLVDQSTSCLKP